MLAIGNERTAQVARQQGRVGQVVGVVYRSIAKAFALVPKVKRFTSRRDARQHFEDSCEAVAALVSGWRGVRPGPTRARAGVGGKRSDGNFAQNFPPVAQASSSRPACATGGARGNAERGEVLDRVAHLHRQPPSEALSVHHANRQGDERFDSCIRTHPPAC